MTWPKTVRPQVYPPAAAGAEDSHGEVRLGVSSASMSVWPNTVHQTGVAQVLSTASRLHIDPKCISIPPR